MLVKTTSPFLRRALLLDAVATGATALLLVLGAPFLAGLLSLPTGLLRAAGAILMPFVALLVVVASRTEVSAALVWAIVAANLLWVVASIVLLVGSWVDPTALGYAFVIAQAVVVGLFAELQMMGLRKAVSA